MEPERTVDDGIHEVTNTEGMFVDTQATLVPSISSEITVLAKEMGSNISQHESILERLIHLMGLGESLPFYLDHEIYQSFVDQLKDYHTEILCQTRMNELIKSQTIEHDDAFPLNIIVQFSQRELIDRFPAGEIGKKRSALLDFERKAIRRKVYDKHRCDVIYPAFGFIHLRRFLSVLFNIGTSTVK